MLPLLFRRYYNYICFAIHKLSIYNKNPGKRPRCVLILKLIGKNTVTTEARKQNQIFAQQAPFNSFFYNNLIKKFLTFLHRVLATVGSGSGTVSHQWGLSVTFYFCWQLLSSPFVIGIQPPHTTTHQHKALTSSKSNYQVRAEINFLFSDRSYSLFQSTSSASSFKVKNFKK